MFRVGIGQRRQPLVQQGVVRRPMLCRQRSCAKRLGQTDSSLEGLPARVGGRQPANQDRHRQGRLRDGLFLLLLLIFVILVTSQGLPLHDRVLLALVRFQLLGGGDQRVDIAVRKLELRLKRTHQLGTPVGLRRQVQLASHCFFDAFVVGHRRDEAVRITLDIPFFVTSHVVQQHLPSVHSRIHGIQPSLVQLLVHILIREQ
mmetsp:Transcript_2488/g.7457  ORF Transcript_2488/g.7457 Transcript_2488/m.7457 type:complete len:202 (+) Transcript_2488:5253-5858(+)